MLRLVVVAVVAGLSLAAPAGAATLSATGDTITYQAAPGEANFLTLNWGGGRLTFTDSPGVPVTLGAGCDEAYDGAYQCTNAAPDAKVVVRLGDGNDTARILQDEQRGHRHELYGEGGDDQLMSEEGSDLLDGGEGNDVLQPDDMDDGGTAGTGDVVVGGPGQDLLQLANSPQPVLNASLNDVADDGGPGEGDDYRSDVEDIQGARGAQNTLVGSAGPNVIQIITDDRVPNAISGGAGDDRLIGGPGDDTIDGGAGTDAIAGGDGNDRLVARDGVAEAVDCGFGADTAVLDQLDAVPADSGVCEVVDRAAVGSPTPGGGGATGPAIRSKKLAVRRGRVAVSIGCPAGGARCRGTVRVRRGTVLLASGRYSIAAGKRATPKLRLSAKGRRLLRRTKAVRVRVSVKGASKTVTLRR